MVIKSWESNETLEELSAKRRNGEIVEGVVRSITSMKFPTEVDGVMKSIEQTMLKIALPGGVTGYCPASEFRERDHRSYNQFVTHKESFIITDLDLDNQIAVLSANKAAEQLRVGFWERLEDLKLQNRLDDEVFVGTVTGYNRQSGVVYVRISGQDTYMFRTEWSWREREAIDAQQGEKVEVKILLFDKEQKVVRVSRKQALPDPFAFLDTLKKGEIIAGRVDAVHPIHGLFVEVENGVVLKAGKVRSLEEPDVGDRVTCRVGEVDPKNRRGRVTILEYPHGKRTKKDLGSFLFD
ncbi:hypothetical protein [Sporosarcina sp. FSL K6-1508]|uniref:hypothetical protein n=1 Tax=Sporosarcina sp. FSL K6-1508 TaxID=2921553 RepID=UPI0030F66A6B